AGDLAHEGLGPVEAGRGDALAAQERDAEPLGTCRGAGRVRRSALYREDRRAAGDVGRQLLGPAAGEGSLDERQRALGVVVAQPPALGEGSRREGHAEVEAEVVLERAEPRAAAPAPPPGRRWLLPR